jgi:N utilization substance protein B
MITVRSSSSRWSIILRSWETHSEGWSTNRLGKAELAIMRLAVYEIKFDDEIPNSVAINEAVELSKKYGGDNSSSFVNGVLAKIIK